MSDVRYRPGDHDPRTMGTRQPGACVNGHGTPKAAWDTRGDAFVQAREVSRGNKDGHVRPYLCDTCGRWHIGHAIKGMRAQGT